MALAPGTRLGPYEIRALLGEGGMGVVYRAHDTQLKREVAIKVLPEAFAQDPDRLARFQREAELLATLNHPNIAAVYGLEQSDGITAIVLELVEGETLAGLIDRGPIAIADALPIARQIAEALEGAHEKGVIHRDLKPANIKVTPDGRVKVLDFGLAKLVESSGASGTSSALLTQSPTITTPAMMTNVGLILGTAAYMSPEQTKGRSLDKRSDIWAFGCVLFEMLTGTRAFEGDDMTDVIAFILTREPAWTALPADTPEPIRTLLRRCIQKERTRRLADIVDARLEIEDALTWRASGTRSATADRGRSAWQRVTPWIVAGSLGVGLGLALSARWRTLPPREAPLRVSAALGADASLVIDQGAAAVLSPDGAVLAFVAQTLGGKPQLFVRRLDQLRALPLSGTDDARHPFFSPDGQWIAFFADGKLKKISVTGGATVTLGDASPDCCGGTWTEDGTIAFSPDARGSLMRVSSAGGPLEPLIALGPGENTQRWPQVLPGDKAVLYTSHNNIRGFENANLVIQELPTGTRHLVQRGAYYGRYLPTGHLVFIHEGTLFAAPFDLARLQLASPPVPVLEDVAADANAGGAQFAASDNGTAVFVPGQGRRSGAPIDWMERSGHTMPLRATPVNWANPAFAPDGGRLAVDITDGKQQDVWVYDWTRDTLSRLTSEPAGAVRPVWAPNGRRIAFASARANATFNLYWQRADGTGEVQRLTDGKNAQFATSWHPSGTFLAFNEVNTQTTYDVMILPIEGDETSGWKPGKPRVFLSGSLDAMFSPDGQWVAYCSDESGRPEVYVRPYPGPGGKWPISTGGGMTPTWSRTRHELFYSTLDQRIMVARYTVDGESFRPEKPRLWSEGRHEPRGAFPIRNFDLHPDGERLALAKVLETEIAKRDHVTFIFKFFDELRRLAPVRR